MQIELASRDDEKKRNVFTPKLTILASFPSSREQKLSLEMKLDSSNLTLV